jgi:Bacterial regulatory protein, Fis family
MGKTLRDLKRDYERNVVTETLKRYGWDRDQTAKILGITSRALDKILERHHLVKRRYTQPIPMPQDVEQSQRKIQRLEKVQASTQLPIQRKEGTEPNNA